VRQARWALVLSLALLAIAGALTLTRSPMRVVRVSAKPEHSLGTTTGSIAACQADEVLPGGVSAIRLHLEAPFGPPVLVRVYSGSRVLTAGSRAADWTSSSVTVPVEPLQHSASKAKLCFYVRANSERLKLYGVPAVTANAARAGNGQALPGRMSVEYLTPAPGSWWSRVVPVARRIGIGHAIGGTWVALLAAALVAGAAALLIGLAWRELP